MTNVHPLEGLKVLEFSHAVMGPTAGLLLAELGADVIKIEPAPGGDPTRQLAGFAAGYFSAYCRSKRSLAIDLKHPEGKALVHRLVAEADVVLENYGPGTMDRLDCGYTELSAINPRLIYLALKGYLKGPYENRPALDEVVQFHAGLAWMTGPPGKPMRAGASVNDIMGAMFGVIALQSALIERQKTGKGTIVSAGLFENACFLMSNYMAGMIAGEQELRPMPARRGAWAIYEPFATKGGGQVFVGVTSDSQWTRFVKEFELQQLADDPKLATNRLRTQQREHIRPIIQARLLGLELDDVKSRLDRANVSWAPVGKPSDLFEDPHLQAAGGLVDVFVGKGGGAEGQIVPLPALPMAFGQDRARPGLVSQPPLVGQHSEEILRDVGVSAEEFARLSQDGVVASTTAERLEVQQAKRT
ncbi:CaiB/BaiF CoA transferase family protein [Bradyrhizobium sp. DOA9]|uniref:CaiB/BaiF CoA transferase family protein n=1 Tax=Bradyrhizobium sp. DOA9 TaxID=1126627 RepID=UPI00046AB45B|nr:CaiB/BaiF CoA-transferase family protein [Bradyrhizobium sp. DOA9]GAJ37930.1 hypothetical protein yfdE [Bradyrhizobium sp. DOA9]